MKTYKLILLLVVFAMLAVAAPVAHAAAPSVGPETVVASSKYWYSEVTAAADPATGHYLVVTEDERRTEVTLVGTAGDTPSAPRYVTGAGRNPDAAFDGQRYLIVWNDSSWVSVVGGTFVGTDGSLQSVHIGDHCQRQGAEYHPSVAWQPSPGGGGSYVVVYATYGGLQATRFGPLGPEEDHNCEKPLPKTLVSSDWTSGGISNPDVVATASGLLVGWQQGSRAYVAALSPDLDLVAPPTQLGTAIGAQSEVNLAVAGDGSALATWVDDRDVTRGLAIYGAAIHPDGSVVNPQGTRLSWGEPATALRDRAPGVAWNGHRYIVTWLRESLVGADAAYASAVSISGEGLSVEPAVPLGEAFCCTAAVAGPTGRVAAITARPDYSANTSIYKMLMRFIDEGADPPPVPAVGATGGSVQEGNDGPTHLIFNVSLSHAASTPVSVDYHTNDVSATAGSDYTATSGTLTFAAGETSRTVAVPVHGDLEVEPDEEFTLNLSAPTGATLDGARSEARGTIVNDDSPPPPQRSLVIDDVSKKEGHKGTSVFRFTVTMNEPSNEPVQVSYTTADGTATGGSDFSAASGSLTLHPGSTTGSIDVTVFGDKVIEPDEIFYVYLEAVTGATAADDTGAGTILNDDREGRSRESWRMLR